MIALDTHAWFWWLSDPDRLSPAARRAIEAEHAGGRMLVSAASVSEIAVKNRAGTWDLPLAFDAWYSAARRAPRIEVEPLEDRVAIESTRLPGEFHRDPADRFIVALARVHGVPLVSFDARIRAYPHVRAIW